MDEELGLQTHALDPLRDDVLEYLDGLVAFGLEGDLVVLVLDLANEPGILSLTRVLELDEVFEGVAEQLSRMGHHGHFGVKGEVVRHLHVLLKPFVVRFYLELSIWLNSRTVASWV